jgi:peptidoglycan/xylan/chitin deacetylase (PgdA/CDA1 family)
MGRGEMVTVLMYHAILHPIDQTCGADVYYSVAPSNLIQHLDLIRGCGYMISSVNELLTEQQAGVNNTVALTFDDGHISNYDIAFPLLLEKGVHADFFVNPVTIGQAGYMTWGSLRQMAESGMSIQSHGYSHRYFDEMTKSEIRDELDRSKKILEDKLGQSVKLFAPPGGRLRGCVHLIAKELGYQAICGSRPGRWSLKDASYDIPRLAVLFTTPLERINRWIRGDRIELARQITRYQTTYIAKKLFGNRLYEDIRTLLLRAMSER